MRATIAIMEGDGIGPEIVPQGVLALEAIAKRFGHDFALRDAPMGYTQWKNTGIALAPEVMELCRTSDGILHGAAGPADSEYVAKDFPPGWGKRQLCRELDHRISIRPMQVFPAMRNVSPFKPDRIEGADFVIVRDMTLINKQGLATTGTGPGGRTAEDRLVHSEDIVTRSLKFAFLLARARRGKLCLMTQSSIYATSRLWLAIFQEMAARYPEVQTEVMAPDNCAMQLVRNPRVFDVIVTDNTPMGGILNNIAAMFVGSIGMAPGTSVGLVDGERYTDMVVRHGLYEPIHGSAPLRAGQWIVNPIGTILAAAMLLRYSLALEDEARAVENAVAAVLAQGYRTYDIMEDGMKKVGTKEMGERIAAAIAAG